MDLNLVERHRERQQEFLVFLQTKHCSTESTCLWAHLIDLIMYRSALQAISERRAA